MKRILILEDTSEVIEALLDVVKHMEVARGDSFQTSVIKTAAQVVNEINPMPPDTFSAILLDRNALDGSFHVLDIAKFGPDKIISISSLPVFNEAARTRGVERVVEKDHQDLRGFSQAVAVELKEILW